MSTNRFVKRWLRSCVPQRLCMTRLRKSAEASVLLTFDDGPHPEATPAVLEELQKAGARAVFFVVGDRIQRAPHLLNRIVDEGHWIGNHTWTHPNDRRMGYIEYLSDLRRCQAEIREIAGVTPRFHRPPHGQLTWASLAAPQRLGLVTMNWSCSSEDWRWRSDAEGLARVDAILSETASRSILLFHDERLHTARALQTLLPELQRRGLNLAPDLKRLL